MIEFLGDPVRDIVLLRTVGKLTDKDYESLILRLTSTIAEQGAARLYLELHDFRGWEARAAWEEFKFGWKHGKDITRLALVGDKRWEEWMAKIARPFTAGEVRYFDLAEREEALRWIHE